jgi:hypothetical protein
MASFNKDSGAVGAVSLPTGPSQVRWGLPNSRLAEHKLTQKWAQEHWNFVRQRSELGQTRRFDSPLATSALPRSTDINRPARLVRLVPQPDLGPFKRSGLRSLQG